MLICTDFGFADIGSAVVGAGRWSAVASRIGLPIEENRVEQEEIDNRSRIDERMDENVENRGEVTVNEYSRRG